MRKRGCPALLRCGWLLAVMCSSAAAFGQTLTWEASLGFGGAYKEGAWAPVFVDISNQGNSQTGEIRVPIMDANRSGRTVTTYAVPVEAPRNSKKRYMLYVPSERVEKIYLRLGRTQYERDLSGAKAAGRGDSLIVVLGGDRGLLTFLQGAQAAPPSTFLGEQDPYGGGRSSQQVIQIGRAEWNSLPDSWLGWDGVDAVVLGDSGFAGASPESVESLLRWVELGGTLIVPGGALSPQMAASPVGRMLPLSVQSTTTAPGLDALAAWAQKPIQPGPVLLAAGPLSKGASVLCGSTEQPLVAVRAVGAGRIAMAAFDYTSAPVKYWDGQTAMWQRLIAQAPAPPSLTEAGEQTTPYSPQIALSDAAAYTRAAALPPFWLLLGFLGAYIIVLVPVNYAVLKRRDKRELAWVTTPIIVIAFTLGAYVVGYSMRGGDIILNRLAVVEAAPGTGLARGRGYVGLFSPGRTSYELLLKGTAASARSLSNEAGPASGRGGSATVVYGPEPKITDISMNMWTSSVFCVEFLADLKGGVDGVIEFDGKELSAKVQNSTDRTLRGCRIIRGDRQGAQRDVASGAAAEWSSGRGTGIGDRNRYTGGAAAQPAVKEGMKDYALRSLFGAGGSGQASGPLTAAEPVLVAFADGLSVPADLVRRRPQVNDMAILIVRLPMQLVAGRRMAVPKWMVTGRPIAADGSVSGGEPWNPQLTVSQGSVVFEFRVPLGERGGAARALTLSAGLGTNAGPGAPAGVVLSAFNHRLNSWNQLPGTLASAKFPNAADYMTRDGRVLVKIAAHADSIQLSDIGISGQVDTF